MGLFSFFKKKKEDDVTYDSIKDFSSVKTEIHSHLIPGIDDGSKSMEETITLIKEIKDLGFKKIVTTPHIMSDFFRNTPEIILNGLADVRKALKENNIDIEIEAAAEYYLDDFFLKKLEDGNLLTFGDKYLLFEISYINPPDNLTSVIFKALTLGYKPVLAHPERYEYWFQNMEMYDTLHDAGALFQLNTISLTGYYGHIPRKIAQRLIDKNYIDFIGSDMHGDRHLQALKRSLNEKYLWKLHYQGIRNSLV